MVGAPALADADAVYDIASSTVLVSARWRGGWRVEAAGLHRFAFDADDGAYLEIDGERVLDTRERGLTGHVELEEGFHRVEIGYFQTGGDANLRLRWLPPGGEGPPKELAAHDLYPGRPWRLRAALRELTGTVPSPLRRALGFSLLVALGVFLARSLGFPRLASTRRRRVWLLAGLFVATFLVTLPYTGSIRGGDDTAYLSAARFNESAWFFNRYAHVYLLKLFMTVTGDAFFGVRVWWAFCLAVTVTALAVATRALAGLAGKARSTPLPDRRAPLRGCVPSR